MAGFLGVVLLSAFLGTASCMAAAAAARRRLLKLSNYRKQCWLNVCFRPMLCRLATGAGREGVSIGYTDVCFIVLLHCACPFLLCAWLWPMNGHSLHLPAVQPAQSMIGWNMQDK
jgi:hypothetical protein